MVTKIEAPDLTKMSNTDKAHYAQRRVQEAIDRINAATAPAREKVNAGEAALAQHNSRISELRRQLGQIDADVASARRERGANLVDGANTTTIEKRIRALNDERDRVEDQIAALEVPDRKGSGPMLERDALLASLDAARQHHAAYQDAELTARREVEELKARYDVAYQVHALLHARNPYGIAASVHQHIAKHKEKYPELYAEAANA